MLPGAIGLTDGVFGDETAPLLLRDIECSGSEGTLRDCVANSNPEAELSCGRFDDAGVVCQRKVSLPSDLYLNFSLFLWQQRLSLFLETVLMEISGLLVVVTMQLMGHELEELRSV